MDKKKEKSVKGAKGPVKETKEPYETPTVTRMAVCLEKVIAGSVSAQMTQGDYYDANVQDNGGAAFYGNGKGDNSFGAM
jgi:hypothetical protein